MLGFDTPGFLLGHYGPRPSGEMLVNACVVCIGDDHSRNLHRLLPEGGTTYHRIKVVDLARMLAKIAHSYAVAEVGLGSFMPLMGDFILERQEFDENYLVGGYLELPDREPEVLHKLDWGGTARPLAPRCWSKSGCLPPLAALSIWS